MLKVLIGATAAVCLAAPCLAQFHSYEETVVRQTYAKMTYLTEVSRINEAALATTPPTREALRQSLADETVRFQLSNFTVGNVADILNTPWSSLVTQKYKMSDVLSLSLNSQTYSEDNVQPVTWLQVNATWEQGRFDNVNGAVLALVSSPVSTFLPHLQPTGAIYTRYASFTVTSSFKGKSNGPYNAMFLFGKDASGKPVVTPEDLGNEGSAIAGVSANDGYPYGLLRTSLRDKPLIAEWLLAATLPNSDCVEGHLCCADDRCGLRVMDLQQELRTPTKNISVR